MTEVNEELIVYRLNELGKIVTKISDTQDKIMDKINAADVSDAKVVLRLDNLEAENRKAAAKFGGISAAVVTTVIVGVVEAVKQLWHR